MVVEKQLRRYGDCGDDEVDVSVDFDSDDVDEEANDELREHF